MSTELRTVVVGTGWKGPEALTARISQIDPDLLGRLPDSLKRQLQDALATQHDKLLRLGYSVNVTRRAQLSANVTRDDKAGSPVEWSGFASLSVAIGWRTIASAVTSSPGRSSRLSPWLVKVQSWPHASFARYCEPSSICAS